MRRDGSYLQNSWAIKSEEEDRYKITYSVVSKTEELLVNRWGPSSVMLHEIMCKDHLLHFMSLSLPRSELSTLWG